MPPRFRKRLHWVALYAVVCVVEFAVSKAKEWLAGRITAPDEEHPNG